MSWEFKLNGSNDAMDVETSVKAECERFVNDMKMRFGEQTVQDGTFTGISTDNQEETLRRM